MIKASQLKEGSLIRFDSCCDEYSSKEYDRFLNCDLKVTGIKFYQQGIICLKLSNLNGEEISLPLDIYTANKWFSKGIGPENPPDKK